MFRDFQPCPKEWMQCLANINMSKLTEKHVPFVGKVLKLTSENHISLYESSKYLSYRIWKIRKIKAGCLYWPWKHYLLLYFVIYIPFFFQEGATYYIYGLLLSLSLSWKFSQMWNWCLKVTCNKSTTNTLTEIPELISSVFLELSLWNVHLPK